MINQSLNNQWDSPLGSAIGGKFWIVVFITHEDFIDDYLHITQPTKRGKLLFLETLGIALEPCLFQPSAYRICSSAQVTQHLDFPDPSVMRLHSLGLTLWRTDVHYSGSLLEGAMNRREDSLGAAPQGELIKTANKSGGHHYRVRFRHGVCPTASATRADIKKYDYFFDEGQVWLSTGGNGSYASSPYLHCRNTNS